MSNIMLDPGRLERPARRSHAGLNLRGKPFKYIGLVEYILRHLGRVPVLSQELRRRVVDDYGHVDERAFYNYLRVLRQQGVIKATPHPERLGYYPTYLYSLPEQTMSDRRDSVASR